MKRAMFSTLSLIALLFLAACGGDESKANATTTTAPAAPELPADVQAIAEATQTVAPVNGTASQAAAAETSNDAIVSTGEFVSPVRSEVAPKVLGRVARLYVDEGALVTRGQPLLALETEYLQLNLQSAQAEVARAKAMLDEAARDVKRKQDLIAKSSIPQATFDRSQANYDQARAAYAGANAQASLLRQQIADSVVRSPIPGVVSEKRTNVGQKLGDGGIAMVVVQLSPLKLRFSVPERYLGRIRPGQTVTAHVDPYPTETFTGTIRVVGGVIDPKTRTMFAEAEFANRDGRLRPGLFARVEAKLN